jgi:hypothetical protein
MSRERDSHASGHCDGTSGASSEETSKNLRHSDKLPLEMPSDPKHAESLLEGIDREVAFYRHRAGQVFFYGLLVEILILAGQEKESILIPDLASWVVPLVYSVLFLAVVTIGITLGSEYRQRIRILKDARVELLEKLKYLNIYPSDAEQKVSEIQVLYVVLIFLSSCGSILVWMNSLNSPGNNQMCLNLPVDNKIAFYLLFCIFVVLGLVGVVYSIYRVVKWARG